MKIIGCDLHAAQQTIAMLDRETGEVSEKILKHDGEAVREFYGSLPAPVVVGIEATGSMGWFLRLMDELGITCQGGAPHEDPEGGDPSPETRSARCGTPADVARRRSVSGDLAAVDRTAGSASAALAPASVGPDAHARAECAARHRPRAGLAARAHALESRRSGRAHVVSLAAAHRTSSGRVARLVSTVG